MKDLSFIDDFVNNKRINIIIKKELLNNRVRNEDDFKKLNKKELKNMFSKYNDNYIKEVMKIYNKLGSSSIFGNIFSGLFSSKPKNESEAESIFNNEDLPSIKKEIKKDKKEVGRSERKRIKKNIERNEYLYKIELIKSKLLKKIQILESSIRLNVNSNNIDNLLQSIAEDLNDYEMFTKIIVDRYSEFEKTIQYQLNQLIGELNKTLNYGGRMRPHNRRRKQVGFNDNPDFFLNLENFN